MQSRARLSIAGVMFLVLLAAVAFAALRSGSIWWASTTFTSAVFTLATSALVAMFRTGATRAFAAGFTLFGSLYLWLVFFRDPVNPAMHGHGVTPPPLITRAVVDLLASRSPTLITYDTQPSGEPIQDVDASQFMQVPVGGTRTPVGRIAINALQVRRLAHSLLALAVAFLGGFVGLWAAHIRPSAADSTAEDTTRNATPTRARAAPGAPD
jgi:hypothetical protein